MSAKPMMMLMIEALSAVPYVDGHITAQNRKRINGIIVCVRAYVYACTVRACIRVFSRGGLLRSHSH